MILKKPLYLYTKHPGSIMAINGHKRRVNDYVVSLGILRDFLESEHAYETYKGSFNYYARRCITASWLTIYRYHKAVGSYRGFLGNIRRCTRGVTRYIGRGYPQRAAREPVFPPVLPDGEPQKGGRNH